jgi:hypothetical protein
LGVDAIEEQDGVGAGKFAEGVVAIGEDIGREFVNELRSGGRSFRGEDCNLLGLAAIEDGEIFFLETGEGLIFLVADGDVDLHQAGGGADDGGIACLCG